MNKYLQDAEAAMKALEDLPAEAFGELGPEITLQVIAVKAALATAQEAQVANILAREAGQRQHTANLIAYGSLFKLLRSSIPMAVKLKIDQAMLGDDQTATRLSSL